MEGIKNSNKTALQETIFDQNKQLAILKADKNFETSTALQASAAKIDENLAVLRSNLKIGELGVANEFDLEKLNLTQGFDRELNNTNNALKELQKMENGEFAQVEEFDLHEIHIEVKTRHLREKKFLVLMKFKTKL